MNTLCFTGHRKINNAYRGPANMALENYLIGVLERAYDKGVRNFISGGAVGVDQIAARAVIRLRDGLYNDKPARPDTKLIIARPFPSQDTGWPDVAKREFKWILERANKIFDVSKDPYAIWKLQRRNIWMVDQANIVIACWNGTQSGGTYNCIKYAQEKKRPVLVVHPTLLTEQWI